MTWIALCAGITKASEKCNCKMLHVYSFFTSFASKCSCLLLAAYLQEMHTLVYSTLPMINARAIPTFHITPYVWEMRASA